MRKLAIMGSFIMMLSMLSCDKIRPDEKTNTLPLTRSEATFVEINKDFATELLQMYYEKKGMTYDFVLSPVSLQMFFGMLNAAASEDQATQLKLCCLRLICSATTAP